MLRNGYGDCHLIDVQVQLARWATPTTERLAMRVPVGAFEHSSSYADREHALHGIVTGFEHAAGQLEDGVRKVWGMESRQEAHRRRAEDRRRRSVHVMFSSHYMLPPPRDPYSPPPLEDEDYPLGECPPL